MAYPTSVKTYTALTAGKALPFDVVQSFQDEITAIETNLLQAWTAYTPTWTNGTLGNGVLTGKKWIVGKIAFYRIDLVWGSTTSASAGSGWRFSLPVTAVSGGSSGTLHIGTGEAIDASAVRGYALRGRLHTSNTDVLVYSGDGAGFAQLFDTSPFTWANTDELHLAGWVEIA